MQIKVKRMLITQAEKLHADIDCRLQEMWSDINYLAKNEGWETKMLIPFLRWAYSLGYEDGQQEPFGKLHRDNGYRIPIGS